MFKIEISNKFTKKNCNQRFYRQTDRGFLRFAFPQTNIIQTKGLGLEITKTTIYNTFIYFISVSVNIGCLFIFVPVFRLIGVVISLLLTSLSLTILACYNSERLYNFGFYKKPFSVSLIITSVFVGLTKKLYIDQLIKFLASLFLIFIMIFYLKKRLLNSNNIFFK